MKAISILAALLLAGCASVKKQPYIAPSSVAVSTGLVSAHKKLDALKDHVDPAGQPLVKELQTDLFNTQVNLGKYVSQVDEQSRQLHKAENDVIYWHDKQVKALKEVWFWRSIALAILAITIIGIGIKTSWKFFL